MTPIAWRRFLPWTAGIILLGTALPAAIPSPARPSRAGEGVEREIERRGEASVVVTLFPDDRSQGSSPRARVDEVLRGQSSWDVEPGHRLESVPVFTARIRRRGLATLLADPRIARVDLDGEIRGADAVSAAQIGADRVQELSIVGQGVTVAVLDSGTDIFANPDLDPALAGEECFCSRNGGCCPDGSSRQSGPGAARTARTHGPGVMGIIASQGVVAPRGIAPGAKVLMVRVLDEDLIGDLSDILLALDWVVTHGEGVRVVNLSLAGGPYAPPCDHADSFNEAVAQLSEQFRQKGGLLVAASGNFATPTLLGSPACVEGVISVGSVDASDQVSYFSGGGTSLDLLAPGEGILTDSSFGRLDRMQGTSAAAPHVAAAAALLLSANPSLTADEIEQRLTSRGLPVLDARTGLTTPRVDVFRALLLPLDLGLVPAVFSQRSRGRGFTMTVQPRAPFTASELDLASLEVSLAAGVTVQVDPSATRLGDSNGDGVEDVQLRLDRRALMSGVSGYGELLLTAQGAYRSGVEARGSTPLRLLRAAGNPRGLEPTP